MTAKTMAEVIHQRHCLERVHNEDCMFWQEDHESAAALSAAGFGLVADAKAEALEEAVDDFSVNLTVMSGPRIRSWLSSKAAKYRAAS